MYIVSMEFAHLQEKSKIAAGLLRQALSFWISKSVIKEIRKHTYQVVEIFDSSAEQGKKKLRDGCCFFKSIIFSFHLQTASVHENEEQGGTSETDQTIESMRVYWTFVQGMLTNLGSLPLDRIHSMLNMFAKVPTPYSKTSAELKRFLEVMVQEEKVEYVDGMYKLKK